MNGSSVLLATGCISQAAFLAQAIGAGDRPKCWRNVQPQAACRFGDGGNQGHAGHTRGGSTGRATQPGGRHGAREAGGKPSGRGPPFDLWRGPFGFPALLAACPCPAFRGRGLLRGTAAPLLPDGHPPIRPIHLWILRPFSPLHLQAQERARKDTGSGGWFKRQLNKVTFGFFSSPSHSGANGSSSSSKMNSGGDRNRVESAVRLTPENSSAGVTSNATGLYGLNDSSGHASAAGAQDTPQRARTSVMASAAAPIPQPMPALDVYSVPPPPQDRQQQQQQQLGDAMGQLAGRQGSMNQLPMSARSHRSTFSASIQVGNDQMHGSTLGNPHATVDLPGAKGHSLDLDRMRWAMGGSSRGMISSGHC